MTLFELLCVGPEFLFRKFLVIRLEGIDTINKRSDSFDEFTIGVTSEFF